MFMTGDNVVRFVDPDFMHNYEISTMRVAGTHVLDSGTPAQIYRLSELGYYASQICRRLGLSTFPEVGYNIHHGQSRQYRTGQAVPIEKKNSKLF
jgi:hypothetical protein